jgi:DNA topoisomerase VI subunit B
MTSKERATQKSAAEFFAGAICVRLRARFARNGHTGSIVPSPSLPVPAPSTEHQQIAGFDNAGKSLFTTIREFVENSLDAAESIHVLPDIEVTIEEFTEQEHNSKHGIDRGKAHKAAADADAEDDDGPAAAPAGKKGGKKGAGAAKDKDQMYYMVTCKDNGCGIPAESIGEMLGVVLSGR